MSSLIIPKYTGAAILLSCRNFINSYRRGFFVQLFSIVACIDRYLFRENIVESGGRIPFVFLVISIRTSSKEYDHRNDDRRKKVKQKRKKIKREKRYLSNK